MSNRTTSDILNKCLKQLSESSPEEVKKISQEKGIVIPDEPLNKENCFQLADSGYCPECESCGEEVCCSPVNCKYVEKGFYCETNLRHLKFGYVMYNILYDMVHGDPKYKDRIDKAWDEKWDEFYKTLSKK